MAKKDDELLFRKKEKQMSYEDKEALNENLELNNYEILPCKEYISKKESKVVITK